MAKLIFSTNQKHSLGKRRCAFCTNQIADIDYKDVPALKHFVDGFQKIKNRYYTGVCLNHQKKLANAIKRARHVALLPFTN
jgi:small subunit ribosomal protein S18